MPVVSSGEATSYNSDSKQTIPGPVGHRAEIEEAVALAASSFSTAGLIWARKPRGRKSRDGNRQSPDLFHRDAFGEVAGFINVAAQLDSEMVGE